MLEATLSEVGFCTSTVERPVHLALCQVGLAADGSPPAWVMLIPAGAKVEALDGRKFSNSNPQAVIDAFNADPRDVPIDWEHATEKRAPKGEEAPAAGWILAMEVRGGEVWGKVEWTPRAEEMLRAKEYRYLSPAFWFSKAGRIVQRIVSAGLVNRPALDMPALANDARNQPGETRSEEDMDPKLLAKLGLAATATIDDVLAAIAARDAAAAQSAAIKAELDVANEKLATSESELATARAATPDLDKFVPRADYDAAVARAEELEAEKVTDDKAKHQAAVDVAITAALEAGKIVPASKDFYVATCATVEGLKQFQDFVKTAPKFGDPSKLDADPKPPELTEGKYVATAADVEFAKSCGLTREQFEKAREAEIADGLHVA